MRPEVQTQQLQQQQQQQQQPAKAMVPPPVSRQPPIPTVALKAEAGDAHVGAHLQQSSMAAPAAQPPHGVLVSRPIQEYERETLDSLAATLLTSVEKLGDLQARKQVADVIYLAMTKPQETFFPLQSLSSSLEHKRHTCWLTLRFFSFASLNLSTL